MTYQGAKARPLDGETKRFFSISKIHLDPAGWPTHVLWGEVNAASDLDVGAQRVSPVADVVDAIHDGAAVYAVFLPPKVRSPDHILVVTERPDGSETIALTRAVLLGAPKASLQEVASLGEEFLPLDVPLGANNPI
jgi:hypothetical protein